LEHGCQYDAESSFRYFLRGRAGDRPDALAELERDLPLGSFLQRYLYNAFGALTFIVPSSRANFRYFRWLVTNRPALLVRVLASHGPFGFQLVRRLGGLVGPPKGLERAHAEALQQLAAESGLKEKLLAIDQLKIVPPSLAVAARAVLLPVLKLGGLGLLLAMASVGVWFSLFNFITHLNINFVLETVLFLVLNLATVMVLLLGLTYALARQPLDVRPQPLRKSAQRIVDQLGVRVVSFGHTHDEVLWRLRHPSGEPAWYFNTGTWIAVFSHETLVPREALQFTFLRVRGREAGLFHWSPGRKRAVPVVLMDE
jgi:hypothetical protein